MPAMLGSSTSFTFTPPPVPSSPTAARTLRRALAAILRDDPFLILQLLRTVGVDVPWRARERYIAPPVSPMGVAADLALELTWYGGPLTRLVVVVEVATAYEP